MTKSGDYLAIGKKWAFDLLEAHFAQPEGEGISDIRTQINNADSIAPLEIGRCYRHPEGLRGRLLKKHDVSVDANRGLKDIELVKVFRGSNIVKRYRFKDGAIRQTATVDFSTHLARGLGDKKFRGGVFRRINERLVDIYK